MIMETNDALPPPDAAGSEEMLNLRRDDPDAKLPPGPEFSDPLDDPAHPNYPYRGAGSHGEQVIPGRAPGLTGPAIAAHEAADYFRRKYRPLNVSEAKLVSQIKDNASFLHLVISQSSPSRERSLALTKLEEAVMWAVKGITG